MNYYLQALKDSFVVKSVSPLAATQCPLEEAHRWKLRILHRSPSLSTSMGHGSPSLSTSMEKGSEISILIYDQGSGVSILVYEHGE